MTHFSNYRLECQSLWRIPRWRALEANGILYRNQIKYSATSESTTHAGETAFGKQARLLAAAPGGPTVVLPHNRAALASV